MIEITQQEAFAILDGEDTGEYGLLCEWGAVGSDREKIIIFGEKHLEGKYFIATQDDLEHSKDGVFVQIKHPENPPPPEFEDMFRVEEL